MEEKILIVEDSDFDVEILERHLKTFGYEYLVAKDRNTAIGFLRDEKIRLVLLDWQVGDTDGLEIMRESQFLVSETFVPIIMVTGNQDETAIITAIDNGAFDFIRKPVGEMELFARIKNALKNRELNLNLRGAALTDYLTKLPNRGHFNLQAQAEIERATRYNRNLTFSIIDVDHFKEINDTFGHEMGDMIMIQVGEYIQDRLRGHDFMARFGGDEFALLFPEASGKDTHNALDRIRSSIAERTWGDGQRNVKVTISCGVSQFNVSGNTTMAKVMRSADKALYEAKSKGRNRIESI